MFGDVLNSPDGCCHEAGCSRVVRAKRQQCAHWRRGLGHMALKRPPAGLRVGSQSVGGVMGCWVVGWVQWDRLEGAHALAIQK